MNMNDCEAKDVVAAYLAGRKVEEEQLRRAWRAARSARGFLRDLHQETMGMPYLAVSCDVFREDADAYWDLTPEERGDCMPKLAVHIQACASCVSWLRETFGVWSYRQDEEGTRRLCAVVPMGAAVDAGGGLHQLPGCAAPEEEGQLVYKAASEASNAGGSHEFEWRLPVPDMDCVVRVQVTRTMRPVPTIGVEFVAGADCPVQSELLWYALLRREGAGLKRLAGGPLRKRMSGISVGQGDYMVSITGQNNAGQRLVWEFAVEIDAEEIDTREE